MSCHVPDEKLQANFDRTNSVAVALAVVAKDRLAQQPRDRRFDIRGTLCVLTDGWCRMISFRLGRNGCRSGVHGLR
jgi:chromosome condensin MukBEF complex kleisin-like MukF subunit